jgi:hypothetical protein
LSNEIKSYIDKIIYRCSVLFRQNKNSRYDNKIILKKIISCVSQTQDMAKRFILISEKHVEHDTNYVFAFTI